MNGLKYGFRVKNVNLMIKDARRRKMKLKDVLLYPDYMLNSQAEVNRGSPVVIKDNL